MRRRYYEANKAAIIQKVTQYAQRTKVLRASFAGEVKRKPPHERKIERDKRRAEVIAECERWRAALKAETVRRRVEQQAEREAQREQLRADRKAESKSRLLRKQAAKKAESAKRPGARLWWKSLSYSDKDVFQCHSCYAADYSRAMPRGFEDFEFGHGKLPKP